MDQIKDTQKVGHSRGSVWRLLRELGLTQKKRPAGRRAEAPRGERLIDHAPFGYWHTQTFIAALRHDRLDAPWVIDGPINRIRHAA